MSKKIHLSGIGGVFMANLAVMLKNKGYQITGSDMNVYAPMSDVLDKNNIRYYQGYSEEHIDNDVDYVVIGNALSRGNPEVEYCLNKRLNFRSAAEVLYSEFIKEHNSIVITGTHGKTTTTALITYILEHAGKEPGYMIGGLSHTLEYSSKAAPLKKGGYFVTEGDEYDTAFFDKASKFLHYHPDILIINNIEFDHADIFDSLSDIERAFALLLRLVPKNGQIFVNADQQNALDLTQKAFTPVQSFGVNTQAEHQIKKSRFDQKDRCSHFEIHYQESISSWRVPLLGDFNIKNTTAAILCARHIGCTDNEIQEALLHFQAPKRRLENLTKNDFVVLYDDFAHHPSAIATVIETMKRCYPNKKIIACYEPRSNTSLSNIFQNQLPSAFSDADLAILYKSKRKSTIAATSQLQFDQLCHDIQKNNTQAFVFDDQDKLESFLLDQAQEPAVILMMSQGGFEKIPMRLSSTLDKKFD